MLNRFYNNWCEFCQKLYLIKIYFALFPSLSLAFDRIAIEPYNRAIPLPAFQCALGLQTSRLCNSFLAKHYSYFLSPSQCALSIDDLHLRGHTLWETNAEAMKGEPTSTPICRSVDVVIRSSARLRTGFEWSTSVYVWGPRLMSRVSCRCSRHQTCAA